MKFNKNVSFNTEIKLDGEVVRDDAIEHTVNELRKFLKKQLEDGQRLYISGNIRPIAEDEHDDWN